jgi:hypothetical protein
MDAIEGVGLAIGEVVQDIGDGPLAWRVGARELLAVEREALQRFVPSPFKLLNKARTTSSRLTNRLKQRRGHGLPEHDAGRRPRRLLQAVVRRYRVQTG